MKHMMLAAAIHTHKHAGAYQEKVRVKWVFARVYVCIESVEYYAIPCITFHFQIWTNGKKMVFGCQSIASIDTKMHRKLYLFSILKSYRVFSLFTGFTFVFCYFGIFRYYVIAIGQEGHFRVSYTKRARIKCRGWLFNLIENFVCKSVEFLVEKFILIHCVCCRRTQLCYQRRFVCIYRKMCSMWLTLWTRT